MNEKEELDFIHKNSEWILKTLDSLDINSAEDNFYRAIFKLHEMLGMNPEAYQIIADIENYPTNLRRWRSLANDLLSMQQRRAVIWETKYFFKKDKEA